MSKFQFKQNKTKADDDFEDDDEGDYDTRSGIFVKRQSVYRFDYYLDSYIGAPSIYRGLFHCLDSMQEHDGLTIHINSGGGRLDSTMQLVDAIHSTDGNVTVVIAGMAASAAGILALQAPNLIITPSSQFMAHNATAGCFGKVGEMVSSVDFSRKYIDKLLDETYSGFMTDQEITDLKKGQDYYFDSDEIIARLEARAKYQEDIMKQEAEIKTVKPSKPKVKAKATAK